MSRCPKHGAMTFDEALWRSLIHNCNFRVKKEVASESFCSHEYSATGLCNRFSCPLANGQYATVSKKGACYCLHQKTAEDTWSSVKLCKKPAASASRLDRLLASMPSVLERAKLRLQALAEGLPSSSHLGSNFGQVVVNKKVEKREMKRERKAEANARVEDSIGQELLRRRQQGLYASTRSQPQTLEMEDLSEPRKELPSKRKVKRKPLAKRKHVEVEYEEELHINRS